MLRANMLDRVLLVGLVVILASSRANVLSAGVNVWTSHGPEGRQVKTLAIDPTTPATLYAGTLYGDGVFKSTDGGAGGPFVLQQRAIS